MVTAGINHQFEPENNMFGLETTINQPLSDRVYVNSLEGIIYIYQIYTVLASGWQSLFIAPQCSSHNSIVGNMGMITLSFTVKWKLVNVPSDTEHI